MSDWRSYDSIARRYDDIWGDRFEEAARHIWARIPHRAGASVLDIGSGTGAVSRALGPRLGELTVVGCDRSAGMLSAAQAQMPTVGTLAAEAVELPFRQSVFDVVTASFVLSHLPDYRAGLIEARRVLKPAGVFAMTSWAGGTNPYSEAWDRLLNEAIPKKRLQEGIDQVTPLASYFDNEKNVNSALLEVGFADVEVRMVVLKGRLSLEDYLAEREITSGGRYAKHILGPDMWPKLIANAREKLRQKFGSGFNHNRGAIIAFGRKK